MTRGGQTYYYHADGLGSVTGLTNSSQALVQTYGYDGFGNLTQAPTIQNPYTYTGREWDAETGLYYYRARYYDPNAGRFLTQDPIGLVGDINLYVYVENNPINFKDPLGLQAAAAGAGATVGAGTGAALGGAIALAICYADPTCRKQMGCFAKYLADMGSCVGKGLCPSGDQEKTESCFRRSWSNYKACIRGWDRPHDPVYPP